LLPRECACVFQHTTWPRRPLPTGAAWTSLHPRRPKASGVRDTLPLCLGSNCSLGKDQTGLSAHSETRQYNTPNAGVNYPHPEYFSLVRASVAWTAAEDPRR